MPDYVYRCLSCELEVEIERPIGTAPNIIRCPDCQGTAKQVLGAGLLIGAGALPNKRAGVLRTQSKDDVLSDDLDAYKRMRHRGIQPNNINGASRVENEVADNFDCAYGRFYHHAANREEARERIKDGLEGMHELAEETGSDWLKRASKPVA